MPLQRLAQRLRHQVRLALQHRFQSLLPPILLQPRARVNLLRQLVSHEVHPYKEWHADIDSQVKPQSTPSLELTAQPILPQVQLLLPPLQPGTKQLPLPPSSSSAILLFGLSRMQYRTYTVNASTTTEVKEKTMMHASIEIRYPICDASDGVEYL